jgi:hypothetical protein
MEFERIRASFADRPSFLNQSVKGSALGFARRPVIILEFS